MKNQFINIFLPILYVVFSIAITSCSDEEPKADPTAGLIKITDGYALGAGAKLEVWGNDDLFAGYNQLYFVLYDSVSGALITDSKIELSPVMDMHTMSHSCPVEQPASDAVNGLFPGAIMFTMPSGDMGYWTLEAHVHNHANGLSGKAMFDIEVKSTEPAKVLSFQTTSGQRYYISYLFEDKMKVGVNKFEVVAYTFSAGEFVPAENLTINFTPEMPSMDHGSPNNENPVHTAKGHYAGKANFTMTGEWRLNLEFSSGESLLGAKHFDVVVE